MGRSDSVEGGTTVDRKRLVLASSILAIVVSVPAIARPRPVTKAPRAEQAERLKQTLISAYGMEAATEPTYIGSEFCLACHTSYATWRDGLHATMHADLPDDAGSMNPANGIIFDANGNGVDDFKDGLDFNAISSPFDAYKPNAPILKYVAGEAYPYRVTIGTVTYKMLMKEGGFFQQRLITRIPVTDGAADGLSRSYYMLPFAYSPKLKKYATYNPDKWWDSTGAPKVVAGMTAAQVIGIGRSWTKACVGCHVTGYSVQKTANGDWAADAPPAALYDSGDRHYVDLDLDGNREFAGVGCESCHGPGSQHVLGGPNPSKILNPKNLPREQQVWLCAQCHTRGKSVPAGEHDYAYNESANHGYRIGDNVWDYYHDEAGLWPDGKTPSKGEQQYQAHEDSKHFTNGFHLVLCSECHDPHSGARGMPVTSVLSEGVQISTSFADNTLCLSCHATHGPFESLTKSEIADVATNRDKISRVVSAHTNHPYAPERMLGMSRCTTCHMPRTAKRDWEYDETSHTMEAISPQKTMLYQDKGGMPSSCAGSCHSIKANVYELGTDPTFKKWDEAWDKSNASMLLKYFGPGGIWWDSDVTKSGNTTAAAKEGRED